MPVFPEVGSITTLSGFSFHHFRSAFYHCQRFNLSFTLAKGFNSDFRKIFTSSPFVTFSSCTKGVLPIDSIIFITLFTLTFWPVTSHRISINFCIFQSIDNSSLFEILSARFHFHDITYCDLVKMLSELTGNMSKHLVPVF